MGKFGYTFRMMGASWQVLKKDKELLLFPLLSASCCIVVMASFALPMFMTGAWEPPDAETATTAQQVGYYALLFLFYFCNYFVIIFFNSAVVACAVMRMRGGDPNVATGFRAAMMRLPQIAGWALVSATISVILRIVENSSKNAGRFVAGLLGMAWSLLTFLVVPVLVFEHSRVDRLAAVPVVQDQHRRRVTTSLYRRLDLCRLDRRRSQLGEHAEFAL